MDLPVQPPLAPMLGRLVRSLPVGIAARGDVFAGVLEQGQRLPD